MNMVVLDTMTTYHGGGYKKVIKGDKSGNCAVAAAVPRVPRGVVLACCRKISDGGSLAKNSVLCIKPAQPVGKRNMDTKGCQEVTLGKFPFLTLI